MRRNSHYANNTSVSVDRSRAEIEKILSRYGAERFMYGWDTDRAIIAFRASSRNIRFVVPMPYKQEFQATPAGRQRKSTQVDAAYEQAVRQKWRALTLMVKAKLEAVQSGIATFEEEFLSYIVLPSGKTVAEETLPAIEEIYKTGKIVPLLTM